MRLLPVNSIAARIGAAIVLAIVLGIALEIALVETLAYFGPRLAGVRVFNSGRSVQSFAEPQRKRTVLAGRLAAIAQILDSTATGGRERLIERIATPELKIAVRDAPFSDQNEDRPDRFDLFRQLMELELGTPPGSVIVRTPALGDGGHETADADDSGAAQQKDAMEVEVALSDGRWLSMTVPDYIRHDFALSRAALFLTPLFILIGVLSFWTARWLAAPIKEFAAAAERLGVDTSAPPLVERGPHELRAAIRAFNGMQARVRRFLDDRTQMLAAMSHDLRTPLSRLRLRAEFIEDGDQQRRMFHDLEAMNTMIDTTLAFVRDDAQREPRRRVDLGVLVEDICEDAAEVGGSVTYSGPPGVRISCRPAAVRRAVTNLVDNAVKYGGVVRVRLALERDRVVIAVDDDGPGVPAHELENVFTPFYRLERSRNADTGGVGLGLSVARTIAREHGGDVILVNGDDGGLCTRMDLPT